jgi:hypothetical protein
MTQTTGAAETLAPAQPVTAAAWGNARRTWGTATIGGAAVSFSARPPDDVYRAVLASKIAIAAAPAPAPVAAKLSFGAFMALFTPAELAVIATTADPDIALFRLLAPSGGPITLSSAQVAEWLARMVAAGCLGAGRVAQIVAGQAQTS